MAASNIARWDGVAWTQFAGGITGQGAFALMVMPNGDFVAGGPFTAAGGVPAANIARWDGIAWTQVGSGVGAAIRAFLLLPNGDLVAGGQFTTAGGVAANRIARWDGTTWSALGNGLTSSGSSVFALARVANGDIIAGGNFSDSNGAIMPNAARWNGTTWSAMASGPGGGVAELAVLPSGVLVAAGGFTNGLEQWTGTTWTTLAAGAGLNNFANSLEILPDGDLVVGGSFTGAGATPANRIARWDGATWTAFGSGLSHTSAISVNALCLYQGSLIVGGRFTTAGGLAVNNIARWSFAPEVLQNPADTPVCVGGTVSLSVNAAGSQPLTYSWRKDGVPLSDGPTGSGSTIAGATTDQLQISGITAADADDYDCLVTNAQGSDASDGATLFLCYPNCDCSTAAPFLNVGDFTCFLTEYAAAQPSANCDGSTSEPVLNVGDFTCFLQKYALGCP